MSTHASPTTLPVKPVCSTVADIIARSAGRFATQTAVEFSDRAWSYADLDAAVTAVALRRTEGEELAGDRGNRGVEVGIR
ncbi:hypothetical protein DN546_32290, partial [Burkholderia multivorans]